MKKVVSKIHLWLGLTSGLVVFILGITGCIYCFEKELRDIFYADRIFVKASTLKPLPIDSLKEIAQAALGKDFPINGIEIKPETNRAYKFRAMKANPSGIHYWQQYQYYKTVYINQYNGEVIAIENTQWEFFNIVLHLHYDLLLNKIGHQIVGYSTIVFVVMLVTGLILWWPKNKSARKQRLWFRWTSITKWKRKNYDAHNIPGFYNMLLALIIALTGLVFAFPWFRDSVRWTANVGKTKAVESVVKSDTTKVLNSTSLSEVFNEGKKHAYDYQTFYIFLPDKAAGVIRITAYPDLNNYSKRNTYSFDRYSGKLLQVKTYEGLDNGEKLLSMNYDIHVGKIAGIPGMVLAFFASLICASLPVTGFMIWLGRKKNSKIIKREEKPMNIIREERPEEAKVIYVP